MIDFYTNETVHNIPPQDYLINLILPEGVSLLSAHPKKGKSILALDWGLSLSAGLNWMGHQCRQVPVLYVLSEARSTLTKRVPAWQTRHGKLSHELTYACGATNLCDYNTVIADLSPHIPDEGMIIWDTMSRNMVGGDENDFRTMGAAIRTCDRLYENHGTSSLLVHHSTKEHQITAGGAKVTGSWYRGHSSLLGAIDMGMTIDEDELVCKAARHDEEFDPIALQRTVIGGGVILDWHSTKAGYR
ncbi:MAG: AAA family ATPase [Candidatus Binataceae bacterium]|jgi:RecA-family ATPase